MTVRSMKIALSLAASLVLAGPISAGPVLAETATPAPTPTTATPTTATTPAPDTGSKDLTKDGKPTAKSVRKECRTSVKSEGLKGDERRKAISDCFIKQRPDLAAKEQCRMDAKAKGLAKGDERKAFLKECVKTKG